MNSAKSPSAGTPSLQELARAAGLSPDRVARLASALHDADLAPPANATLDVITRRPDSEPALLSFAQQRLWFLAQLHDTGAAYHIPLTVRLRGALDPEALAGAFEALVERHEILRTTYSTASARAVQIVSSDASVDLQIVDLSALGADAQAEALQADVERETSRPFDLAIDRSWRLRVLRLGADDHLLVLTLHHIAADAWSLDVLTRELAQLYESRRRGESARLPALPIQYADYAAWQRQLLAGPSGERQRAYWRRQLAGLPVPEVITDKPRPPVMRFRGAQVPLALSPGLTARLRALAVQSGTTLFMTMLSAFTALVSRWSGHDDVAIGTPVAGRTRAETEPLIGLLLNTLVVRTSLAGDPTVRELLGRVRDTCLDTYANQDVPFEQLVDELQPARDMSRNPLFQVLFALQTADTSAAPGTAIGMEAVRPRQHTAKFDLSLLIDDGSRITGALEYATDLFEPETAARMARQYVRVLEQFVASPDARLSSISLHDPRERAHAIAAWNDTAVPYTPEAPDVSLIELIAAQAARTPQAVAVEADADGSTLTYAELYGRATALAHRLRADYGVAPETHVGVVLPRSIDLMVAVVAVLAAGAAYVPLEPTQPASRLAWMAKDADVRVLLVLGAAPAWAADANLPVLAIDAGTMSAAADRSHTEARARPDTAAYVIYTSGSTGQPKGVVTTHRAIVNRLRWMQATFGLTAGDRVLQKTPIGFDVSVWELFWPLLAGARLVMLPPGAHTDPAAVARAIGDRGITTLHFVPSMLEAFLASADLDRCASLRQLFVSGEALNPALQHTCQTRLACALHNLYGPTEAAVDVSWWPCPRGDDSGVVPIGHPIANIHLHVLDAVGEPAPIGMPGELCIGGVGLARGYWRRPAQTAARFVPDPFAVQPGERLYRTGDLARRRADGALEYLGRIDHQVKIRGVRIELGEIEAVLRSHPAVRETVVTAWTAGSAPTRLAAYLVPRDPAVTVTVADLRAYLRDRLPEAFMPAVFTWLDGLPVTLNGKLDRRALPAPDPAAAAREWAAPQGHVETALAAIWAEVLGVPRVGRHDNFFELGGDSILSIEVVSHAAAAGLPLTLELLFRFQSIADLARSLTGGDAPAERAAVAPFALITSSDRGRLPAGVADAYPLAMLQAGMLFHSEYAADAPTYHDVLTFHARASWNLAALQQVLAELTRAHPVLRTSFDVTSYGSPLQLVHDEAAIPIAVDSLRHLPPAAQEEAIAEWMRQERANRFTWTQPPLLRTQVHLRSDTDFQFSLSLHHAILDGWSVATLLSDLFRAYLAVLDGAPPAIAVPQAQFREYVAEELRVQDDPETAAFWRARLASPPEDGFARLIPTPDARGVAIGQHHVSLDDGLGARLQEFANAAGVPLKSVLLAAHLRTLAVHLGSRDVVTGLVGNGRPVTADGERVLGLFLNTIPFRHRLAGGSWRELAQEVFAAERELLPHRTYPLALIQRTHGGQPLFDSIFNYVRFHVYRGLARESGLQVLGGDVFEQTNFPLTATFSGDLEGSRVQLAINYDTRTFSTDRMVTIGDTYRSVLQEMVTAPRRSYAAVGLLESPAETSIVPAADSGHAPAVPDCVDRLFARQVARDPEAVALEHGETHMTYRELDRRTTQLARHLRRLGVGPSVRVGVYLSRSLELPCAFLGILKAGGVYTPIEPSLPRERVAFMLADARVAVLITEDALLTRLSEYHGRLLVADDDGVRDVIAGESIEPIASLATPEHAAYAIYTSGTTGLPKGVLVPHRGLTSVLDVIARTRFGRERGRLLQFMSPGFDFSVFELSMTLLLGGTLVIGPIAEQLQGEALAEWLAAHAINGLCQPPSTLKGLPDTDLPALHLIVAGGEVLPVELARRWARRGVEVLNIYGPTETTVFSSVRRADAEMEAMTIGWPVANTRIYIMDEFLDPTPRGTAGELWIAGAGVGVGYLERPALTAQRFVPDPFSPRPGARAYRTGDLARITPEGEIDYLGRRDDQVKIRGNRIELGEIEARLDAHPAVRAAALVVRPDHAGEARLIAYVVGNDTPRPKIEALRDFVAERLPAVMVPSAFVWLDRLPTTSNGKLDRRALPDPGETRPDLARPYVAPGTPLEVQVADVWREVLCLDRVGIHDSFFEVGGHSLAVLRVQQLLEQRLARRVTIGELFEWPTISQLAAHLARNGSRDDRSAAPSSAAGRGAALQALRETRQRARGAGPAQHPTHESH